MTTLAVWGFDGPGSAEEALPVLERLAADGAIRVDDAALVSWPWASRKPSARTLGALDGPGALWGGSWGVLLGLIFLLPIAGPAMGAAGGAVAGGLSDFGIPDDFIKRVRDDVTPGTSALFLFGGDDLDETFATLAGHEIICCELSPEHDRRLRAALGEETEQPL